MCVLDAMDLKYLAFLGPTPLPLLTNSPDQHVAQLDKVTVVLVFHLHHSPGVQPPANTFSVDLQQCVAPHDGEGNGLLSTDMIGNLGQHADTSVALTFRSRISELSSSSSSTSPV